MGDTSGNLRELISSFCIQPHVYSLKIAGLGYTIRQAMGILLGRFNLALSL